MGQSTSHLGQSSGNHGTISYRDNSDTSSILFEDEKSYKHNPIRSLKSFYIKEQEIGSDGSFDVYAERIFRYAAMKGMFGSEGNYGRSAVCLRVDDEYTIYNASPEATVINLGAILSRIDVASAIVIDSPVVESVASKLADAKEDIILSDGQMLQVFEGLAQLPRARLDQPAAFVRQERLIVVWADDARDCMKIASSVHSGILQVVWNDEKPVTPINVGDREPGDIEAAEENTPPLRERYIRGHITTMLALVIEGLAFGLLVRELIIEYRYDGKLPRFALIAYFPITFVMSLFFILVIITNVWQIVGPMASAFKNSFSYSAEPLKRMTGALPDVTIICPVYKESLSGVIGPTVASVKTAMERYRKQGGQVNLIICDDRMQLVDEASQTFRQEYYRKHHIGWVARPGHGQNGYIRAGRFKKASNMNAMMGISVKVEEALGKVERPVEGWTAAEEEQVYIEILQDVIAKDGRLWGEGNIRIGDLFLLIDSDTRVPSDCLIDAASEFDASPHLAVLQHASGVMKVSHDFFENAMTYFTDHIYRSIRFSCSGGDMAPFVGHNAFIRWRAVQESAEWMHEDGNPRWWSESHVSEDFEMALKLQCAGHSIRLAAYTNGEFKEGVSLTLFDEIARWEKYAYGCSELIFNPVRTWLWKGPITPMFRRFIFAKEIPMSHKFTLLSYIGTYYALACVWLLVLSNYFWTGWAADMIDHAWLDSLRVTVTVVVVFTVPLAPAIFAYRMKDKGFFQALWEATKWTPFYMFFFNGVSFRISMALLSHMFEYNMQWGATSKETDDSDFFRELPRILREFRWTYVFFGLQIPMMIYLARFAPYQWQIPNFWSVYPLAMSVGGHLVMPLALNPKLYPF
ncbi:hypothetical protein YB2330_002614 [Saitoella coloradoensis]